MPEKDKKKDELTLDTTSPPPPAPPSGGPPPTTATTLNASAFALRASLTVYGSDPEIGGVAPSWTDASVRLAASAILHPRVSSRPARRDETALRSLGGTSTTDLDDMTDILADEARALERRCYGEE